MHHAQRLLDIHDRPMTLRFEDRLQLSKEAKPQQIFKSPSFFQIVHVLIDEKGNAKKLVDPLTKDESYIIYTLTSTLTDELHTTPMMLGTFIYSICGKKEIGSILINPRTEKLGQISYLGFDEVLFSPIKDEFTKHYMMTSPDEAKSLLALSPIDRERFGFEVVFYVVTNQSISCERQLREEELQLKIRELAFLAPRTPLKKGSGSFLAIIVNLENKMEESAFIRTYKTYEPYADVIFVTSDLEIKTGDFQSIEYNGNHIDTIFSPLIQWQQNKRLETSITQ